MEAQCHTESPNQVQASFASQFPLERRLVSLGLRLSMVIRSNFLNKYFQYFQTIRHHATRVQHARGIHTLYATTTTKQASSKQQAAAVQTAIGYSL